MYEECQLKIRKALKEQEPDFKFNTEIDQLTDLCPEETRKIILTNPKQIKDLNLRNLYLHFHNKLSNDKNSLHSVTEVLFRKQLPNAEKLSNTVTLSNAEEFPLFGYVLSIKESIRMQGTASTCGLAINQRPHSLPTPFIEYLNSLGATFIAKSNVPLLVFAMESTNNIYGASCNPHDKTRSSGGSSGGEASLVSAKFSHAGIGNDIAGSLRIPGLFCGIYAFVITPARMDKSLSAISLEHSDIFDVKCELQSMISTGVGPLTRTVAELEKLTRIFVEFYKFSPTAPPVPWRPSLKPIKKIGLIKEFSSIMELTLTNRRAMAEVLEICKEENLEIVEIDLNEHVYDLMKHIYAIYLKNDLLSNVVSGKTKIGEKLPQAFDNFVLMSKIPLWGLKILSKVLKDVKQRCIMEGTVLSATFNQQYLMKKVCEHKARFLNELKEKGVEVFLCHGMLPAMRHQTSSQLNFWAIYTLIWNGFQFCGGALPVTKVREDEQVYESRFKGPFEDTVRETMKGSAGLPVGIQVMAPAFKDELALEVMKIIGGRIEGK